MALSDSEYIENALIAVEGMVDVPADSSPNVEHRSGAVVVTWPTDHPPGVRGADFHAQVTLDPDTGEVRQIMGGS